MSDRVRAYISRDWMDDPLASTVRLHIVRHAYVGSNEAEAITRAGDWVRLIEGTRPAEDIGLVIPAEAVEAIQQAVEQYLGLASHSATETKVLREWLKEEQRRVNLMLQAEIIIRDEPAL